MTKILITGGAGFIGSQLAHRLWKDGNNITMVDNFSYGLEDNLIFDDVDFRNTVIRADICDSKKMEELFKEKRFDYVYHIAAITPLPDCQTNPAKAVEVNVAGTVNILELSRKYGVKNVIFSSTSAVYENCTKFPTAEGDAVPPSLVYSTSKFTAEQFCRGFCNSYGMNVTVLRFANVYGPHIDCLRVQPPVIGYMIRELHCGRPVILHSTGTQRRDFVFVDDLINLAVKVMKNSGFDCVNVSTCKTVSINELYEVVAKSMGMGDVKPIYEKPAHFWSNYPNLYDGFYPIKEEVLSHEIEKHTECSYAHAKEKFNWEPLFDLQKGVEATIDYTLEVFKKKGI